MYVKIENKTQIRLNSAGGNVTGTLKYLMFLELWKINLRKGEYDLYKLYILSCRKYVKKNINCNSGNALFNNWIWRRNRCIADSS